MMIYSSNTSCDVKTFSDKLEGKRYFNAQKCENKLELIDTFGDSACVIRSISALSSEVSFCLIYESEGSPDNFLLIRANDLDHWAVQVDSELFFIQLSKSKVLGKCTLFTPLAGTYTRGHRILILEEAGLKVVDFEGSILQEATTDLIENIDLKGTTLRMTTIEGAILEIELLL